MEVYIDDMLVNSLNTGDHLTHLQETFDILKKYNMILNPKKCVFGVGSSEILGFLVSQRGIEYHPSTNRQEESTNKIIIQNLKNKLEETKDNWLDELLGVLWAYRIMAKSSTGETPFSLVYGVKALSPLEIGEQTIRYSHANKEANNEVMLIKLDLFEEHRNMAYVRMVAQKQIIQRYYNRRSNIRYFKAGDLFFRKVTQNTREVNIGKLRPTWERPYRFKL
ncbi:uncharacterized protein [Nicotiana tomentosiformis]|uniref:uncharacterized protein n=1 Tax=Nicotiana tomentosiformis TaxID=4098 RepID=UPI00388CCBCB